MTIHEEETHFQDAELIEVAKNLELQKDIKNYTSLRIGELFLNKYRIVKVLGRGNSSIIYLLVSNDDSQKLFVLKEFFPKGFVERNNKEEVIVKPTLTKAELKNYHLMQEIFMGEAQNLMRVSSQKHPNVVHFLNFNKNINNTHYYVMEYEEGHTLKTYIETMQKSGKPKFSNKEITTLAKGLLNGIQHIHSAGVYHQDIKLENILMRKDASPIIVDFGASVLVHDKENKKYYNTATLKYAAPEQITMDNPPKINETTDIYNIGVLLYRLITDTFPPKADERVKSLSNAEDIYSPLIEQNFPEYDKSLLKAVDKSLSLAQNDRFQNAIDFKEALSVYHIEKSHIVALLVPLIFALIYFTWPNSQDVKQNEDTLKPSTLSHITLPKDVNQSNSKTHKVTILSDIGNVRYLLNGKQIDGNTFLVEEGKNYTLLSMSEGYEPQEYTVDYATLSSNGFVFNNHMLDNKELMLEVGTDLSQYEEDEETDLINFPIEENTEIAQSLPAEDDSYEEAPVLLVESITPEFTAPIVGVSSPIVKQVSKVKTVNDVEKSRKKLALSEKRALEKKQVLQKRKTKERKAKQRRIEQERKKYTKRKRLAKAIQKAEKRRLAIKKKKAKQQRLSQKRAAKKRRERKKEIQINGSVWYCVARTGAIIKSAKKSTKSAAKSTALWSCKKSSRGQGVCRVSCYLWK